MKILNLFIVSVLVFAVSCGGIKERKKDKDSTVENVESYPEYHDYGSDDIADENLEANSGSNDGDPLLRESEGGSTYLSTDEERESSNNASNLSDNTTNNSGSSNSGNTGNVTNNQSNRTVSMYYVVGGSFQDMPKAQRLQKQLRKEGYQAEILEPFQGYNRVSVAKFHNKEDALKTISKVRRQYTKMTFWLLAEY